MSESETAPRTRDEILTDVVMFASKVLGCATSAATGVQWTSRMGLVGLFGFPIGFVGGFCLSLAALSLLIGAVIPPQRKEES